jgi:carbonic anhydrase
MTAATTRVPTVMTPSDALDRLVRGNAEFLERGRVPSDNQWREDLTRGQAPFAVILGCSDSRVPVEIVFAQGFGDLFVVRVAGNIVAPSIVGSIEFAVKSFGSALVVVMGHTQCGAVAAALDAATRGVHPESHNIQSITSRIVPHVTELATLATGDQLMRAAVRANVRASTSHIRHGSRIIEDYVASGRIAVLGAEFEIATGEVTFLDKL